MEWEWHWKPDTKFDRNILTEVVDDDYFLKGFLIGYRREKVRRNELWIKKEEKKKKVYDVNFSEVELRRVTSNIIVNEVSYK